MLTTMTQAGVGTGRQFLNAAVPAVAGAKFKHVAVGTTNGRWASPDQAVNVRTHVVATYDRSATTNDPVIYINGVSVTVTEESTPVAITTGDDTLRVGEDNNGGQDFVGTLAHVAIDAGVIWDAAAVNRAMWWGRPHGGLEVYHPLLTDKLADEGSGAETLTANGTTVVSFVTPCVRPGSMVGMGW